MIIRHSFRLQIHHLIFPPCASERWTPNYLFSITHPSTTSFPLIASYTHLGHHLHHILRISTSPSSLYINCICNIHPSTCICYHEIHILSLGDSKCISIIRCLPNQSRMGPRIPGYIAVGSRLNTFAVVRSIFSLP